MAFQHERLRPSFSGEPVVFMQTEDFGRELCADAAEFIQGGRLHAQRLTRLVDKSWQQIDDSRRVVAMAARGCSETTG